MTIDTAAFVAGVGILVGLDTLSLALTFEVYRQAQQPDEEARELATTAHERLSEHLRDAHGEPAMPASEAFEYDEEARRRRPDEEARHAD